MGANSTSARNGVAGKVVVAGQIIARVTKFTINESTNETAWGDSDSLGYTNRKAGRKDASINFEGKFDAVSKVYNLLRAGDNVKLVLWESTTDSDYWVFPCALIQSFQIDVNMDTKEVVTWNATAGSDGIFYCPGESGAPTETLPS